MQQIQFSQFVRRNLRHLMTIGSRINAFQLVPTVTTQVRFHIVHFLDLFDRRQSSPMARMPFLPSSLASTLADRRGFGATCGPSLEGGCEELRELRLTRSRRAATSSSNVCTWAIKESTNVWTAGGVCAHSSAEKGICLNAYEKRLKKRKNDVMIVLCCT